MILEKIFTHAKPIEKPMGVVDQIIDWCKTETLGDWRWQVLTVSTVTHMGEYIFYFESERDCMAFIMKWA
jgi:hypothetical protein